MAFLGLVTLWAGIASWRRNARTGLHRRDTPAPPAASVHEEVAPGAPRIADAQPAAPPHRRRRRRRSTTDGG
jgi:hypothetical protein